MSAQTRQMLLIGLLVVLLGGAGAWSYRWMLKQQSSAAHLAGELAACRQVATDIAALRRKPEVASAEGLSGLDLGDRVQAAAQAAGLSGGWYKGTYPRSPRRLGETGYMRQETELSMTGLTLRQVAMLLYHLTAEPGLAVSELRLRTPAGDASGDRWDAEATLSYLIRAEAPSPRNTGPSG